MTTVRYTGMRGPSGCVVLAHDDNRTRSSLSPRADLMNHSPTGFEWGYAGSGPAQLALAILADALGDDRRAVRLHQRFKASFVQNLTADWAIDADTVRRWADRREP